MDCREYRRTVFTTRSKDRTETETERLASHELNCAKCARFAAEASSMEGLLNSLGTESAPDGFVQAVMRQTEAGDHPVTAPWYDRLFGSLRPPTPVVTVRHAMAVAALALMVVSGGMLAGHQRGVGPGAEPATVSVADGSSVIEMDKEFVDELIQRHQAGDLNQPLAEDEGMRLVSY